MGKGVRPALPQRKSPAERGWAGAGGGGALGLLPWILRSRHHFPAQIRTQIRLPWLQGAQSCSQLAARTLDGRSAHWPLPLLFLAPDGQLPGTGLPSAGTMLWPSQWNPSARLCVLASPPGCPALLRRCREYLDAPCALQRPNSEFFVLFCFKRLRL
ncbi:uncharacterized protein LOC126962092 isoform X1 [Macaca thibetana thibetana]|uniref:uncharacterized protein LOC126962092 isoform X1 n=1 Tax=Macaca thibetana thibetana TaxID=257877 RepID=UPI0021BC46B1|nr:uncharacterized protein LOC126962092 isoform X1 [Macaca thibetana thibetana]